MFTQVGCWRPRFESRLRQRKYFDKKGPYMNQYSCKHVDIGNFEPGCIVVRVSMILSYGYQASTQLRLQDFDIHLEN